MKPGVSGFCELIMCYPHITCLPPHPGPTCHSQHPSPGNLLTTLFLSLPHSLQPSLSTLGHGRAPPPLPPLKPPYLAGASPETRRRSTPASCTTPLHLLPWSLELLLHLLRLPQASSKKDELELHQALTTIFKTLLVLHSLPLSPSPSPIHLHCPRLEP